MTRAPRWVLIAQARLCLLAGRWSGALQVFEHLLARSENDAYAAASRAHLLAVRLARPDEAIAAWQRLLRTHPGRAHEWFNLGFTLEQVARLDEALVAFARAATLQPQLDRAWYGQGLVLMRLGRFDEAAQALQRCTALQPMSPHGWVQLARVHVEQRQPDLALRIVRHLQAFEPKVAAQLLRECGLQAHAQSRAHGHP